ncbi:HACE1 [Symbiodinium natans]|uniref:HACE1 protein n=1 Tax=Symbiodinium natans TaxID=878477 RepID=A0A812RBS8_9DINO|nr:HACE1 [Symbiodinium natans]
MKRCSYFQGWLNRRMISETPHRLFLALGGPALLSVLSVADPVLILLQRIFDEFPWAVASPLRCAGPVRWGPEVTRNVKALARRMPIFTSAVYLNQCVELDLGERNKQAMTGCEQSLALEAAPQVLKAMISYMSAPKVSGGAGGLRASFAVEGLPPQLCPLALGTAGLARGLAAFAPVLSPLAALLSLAAAIYLCIYATKIVGATASFRRDLAEPATMSAVAAAPATIQVLALRLHLTDGFLPLGAVQAVVLACHATQICCSLRFVMLNIQKRLLPDPSWFPGILMYGMTNVTSFAVGPPWLQATMPFHFWFTMALYVPMKLTVLYRLFLSQSRDAVAPHAGMAALMAPASFYTMAHLSSGKPGGDITGYLLFADSTVSFLLAVSLLYSRRKLWITAFHPTYVAFTFPLASTASAALLASERLPLLAGSWCRAWSAVLLLTAMAASLAVQAGFLRLVFALWGARQKSA